MNSINKLYFFPLSSKNLCYIGFDKLPITKKDIENIYNFLDLASDCFAWNNIGSATEEHF